MSQKIEEGGPYLARILDAICEAMVCTDEGGRILFINKAAQRLWQFKEEQLIGKDCRMLLVEDERHLPCPWMEPGAMEPGPFRHELLFQKADGSCFLGSVTVARANGADAVPAMVILVRDITEEKQLRRRLRESERLACLRHLIKGFSHEIRNPIVGLGGYARRISKHLEDKGDLKEYIDYIVEDVQRLERMLKDIEDYLYYLERHKPVFKRVDLVATMKEVLSRFEDELKRKGIRVRLDFTEERLPIFADEGHLGELFCHLVQNALEAMPEGGTLGLSVKRSGNLIQAMVSDTGVGIPRSDLDSIYEPFYSSKPNSVGIGLAKSYIIVEEHGGSIEAESQLNKGTTFKVTFPVDRRKRRRGQGCTVLQDP